MIRVHTGRVAAVSAATLAGAALTASLVLPRGDDSAGAAAAGLSDAVIPSGSTAPRPSETTTTTADVPEGAAGRAPTGAGPEALPTFTATPAAPTPAGSAAAAPTRVSVPRLGIEMPIEAQGVDDRGEMALPASPGVAGWYRYGSAPDDAAGATVLAAHIDSRTEGIGPFGRLRSAREGDEVQVWVGTQSHAYRVSQVHQIDKVELDGDGLFAVTGSPRLHLVTCTGDYISGSGYTQNLVVVADPVRGG